MSIEFRRIPVDKCFVSEFNVRSKGMQEVGIDLLIASIKEKGIIEPVLAKPREDKYEIIVGSRRFEAAKRAGLTEIPAIINPNITDGDALILSLTENIQREDLTPSEKSAAVKKAVLFFGSYDEVAKVLGYSVGTVKSGLV